MLPKALGQLNTRSERAVVFLDPFGMQIDWAAMVALSKSLVDLWYLVSKVAINRMITRDGEMEPGWGEKLDRFFGDTGWRNRWYSHSAQSDLFGQPDARIQKTATLDLIEADFHARLSGLFVMSSNRLRLTKNNRVLFTLMFGCSNRHGKAATIATRIANHLLKAK
jgi:three-Cys-motif partner protein